MVWWTDILFLKEHLGGKNREPGEGSFFAVLVSALRKAVYDNFLETLHVALLIAVYAYFLLSIFIFFFQNYVSPKVIYVLDAFSEPYLGAIGIYVVVTEIRRRRGKNGWSHLAGVFVWSWLLFMAVSTMIVFLGETYYFNSVYKAIITNSFAALIIRLGAVLR